MNIKLEKLLEKSDRIYFLGYNFAKSMTSDVCEKGATINCFKITTQELKEFSEIVDLYSYFTNNDIAVTNYIKELGIDNKKINERIELNPNRGDVLFLINVRNYSIEKMIEEKNIPKNVTVEIYVYVTEINTAA